MKKQKTQIKSKERVRDHGEVFTNEREVKAMCDLVKNQFNEISTTFMEPSCGDGNFLSEILKRKLKLVSKKYSSNITEWEINSIIAISSIYGIELLSDNVQNCKKRLLSIFIDFYGKKYAKSPNKLNVINSAKYILDKNIINGNALTYCKVIDGVETKEPLCITEWFFLKGQCKQKTYSYKNVIDINNLKNLFDSCSSSDSLRQMSIFDDGNVLDEISPNVVSESKFKNIYEIWEK